MTRRFWFSSVFLLSLTMANPVYGQVVPDPTANSAVLGNCQSSCDISGGTFAGQNLFHSFEEFNIAPGASVYFNDPGVANIFSRVTGNNLSSIRGTLGISGGDANLFLLNPNGIIFGEGAALDLNGSFFATTADEIQFGDRSFAARPDLGEELPLLTVDPATLWFNQSQGSIVLNGAQLEVPARESITLVGKQVGDRPGILIKDSAIDLVEGNLTLGAVGSSAKVEIDNNLQLQFSPEIIRGDIVLKEAAKISVGNLGAFEGNEVRIEARNLAIADDSIINTFTTGTSKGADIRADASESVNITGKNSNSFQEFLAGNLSTEGNVDFAGSSLQTTSLGTGDAGDLEISTPDLRLETGAGIVSTTIKSGASGDINIVTDSFVLNSSSLLTGSNIFSQGKVGQIEINTDLLRVERGGVISSSSLGDSDAGNLTVNAADSIEVRETPVGSIVPTGIFTNKVFGAGQGGNLSLNTSRLMIQDGGQLSSASGAIIGGETIPLGGRGGNISINAVESVEISGASAGGVFSSGILTETRGSSPAGNLTIDTGSLIVRDRGFISASSLGTGTGGEIEINAKDSVEIVGQGIDNVQRLFLGGLTGQLDSVFQEGIISFTLLAGKGGNITINTSQLNLSSGAILATATAGSEDAGNLKIMASDRLDVIGSAVAAPTFGAGNAGKIEIYTKNLSITQGGTIASASLGSGNGGDLFISATESIEVLNANSDILFSSSISTGSYRGLGSSGDLTLNTQRLSIKEGASIQANHTVLDSSDSDNAGSEPEILEAKGKVTINASESLEVSGSASQDGPFGTPANSYIASTTTTSAPANDIQITTPNLSLYDSGAISVNSLGSGAAGTLDIVADNVTLENQGQLNGTTSSGRGGNINLQVDNIVRLENNSAIDTNAIASGDGGNIDLTANFIIASQNSSISANAAAVGDGGNIDLTAKELFITDDSKITADADLGIDGTVEINTSINNEQNNYTQLPQKIVRTENTIVQSCGNGNGNQNVFSYTGKGGLPLNPLREFPINNIVIPDFKIPDNAIAEELEAEIMPEPEPVVEANRWKINANGKVELVATNEPTYSQFNPANCPFAK